MMIKLLILASVIMSGFSLSVQGQQNTPPKIKSAEINVEDIVSALGINNYRFARFDLSEFLAGDYDVTFYTQEFDGKNLKEPEFFRIGKNRIPTTDIPEDQRAMVLEMNGLPTDSKYVEQLESLSVYFTPKNDSTIRITGNAPGFGMFSKIVKLNQIVTPNYSTYMYECRPFDIEQMKLGENTPLMMYASGW